MQKKYRLTSNGSFSYIYKKGSAVSNKHFTMLYTPSKFTLRVGFSVTKKLGKAHVRNKVKRRLKEGFRLLIPYINDRFNFVVVPRIVACDATYHELLTSLAQLLVRTKLIVKPTEFAEFCGRLHVKL